MATFFRAMVRLPAIIKYIFKFGRVPLLPDQPELQDVRHPQYDRYRSRQDIAPVPTKKVTRTFPAFFTHLEKVGFTPGICIDVGAAEGTFPILTAFPSAKHICFEPLADFEERLRNNLAPYDHEVHMCALMDVEEQEEVNIVRQGDLYGSSLMHTLTDDNEKTQRVRVSTLDKELAHLDLSGPVLLKTDCQGADLLVLKGGLNTLHQCDVVIVEASLFRFWGEHQPDFYDIVHFMRQQGFVVYDLLDGLLRPADEALGQIDIVFAKEKGVLRRIKHW
ncbi:FkbM family methyltransferase [Hyphomonas sp.]|uniref:FkbM family methyltransferase n=1 Tax=Hyphomonas sp. TaxID=87 RepID=UPI0035289322